MRRSPSTARRAPAWIPALVAWALLGAPACTSLVWFGRSPDRRHVVRVEQRLGHQLVRRDGRAGERFRAVGVAALVFSPDSRRLAYPAQCGCGDHWFVVVDGRVGPCWDGVGEVRFGPRSRQLVYVAQRGGKWHVVRNGHASPPYDAVFRRSLRFDPTGRHLGFVAQRGRYRHVVVDGRPGQAFHRIAQLRLGRGGRHAYVGQRGGLSHAVIDGKVGPAYHRITALVLRPGRRPGVAYLARRLRSWHAVIDGVEGPAYAGVAGLGYSPDGAHVAYAAQVGQRACVVLDGREQPRYDTVRFATITFTSRGALIYVGSRGGRYRVVHNGREGPAYDAVAPPVVGGPGWGYVATQAGRHDVVIGGEVVRRGLRARYVGDLTLGPRGRHHAYLIQRGRSAAVVHDGRETRFDVALAGSLVLGPRGEHWAVLAGDRRSRRLYVSIDGRRRRPFRTAELTAAVMKRRQPQVSLIRRWVAAELALSTGAGGGR